MLSSQNYGRGIFCYTYLFLLATRISPASPNFGQAKQGQKIFVPTFHIHFLNPECLRIPWVLAPKFSPLKIFRCESIYKKVPFITDLIEVTTEKYRARVPTFLMPGPSQ